MSSLIVHGLEACLLCALILTVYYVVTTPTALCVASLVVLWAAYKRERSRAAGTIPLSDGKCVLITGCDTGMGLMLAKRLHALGCHVIATVLLPDGPGAKELRDVSSDRMTVLPLDVSSDDSVSKCLLVVKDMCKDTGLWGLVNNAGITFLGEAELTTMNQYLRVANVNIFGMVRMTRAFLPLIRQAKGRIVNVTSVRGRISYPYNAAYGITKFAGETFSDITRLEMSQFGVKVIVIEPGNYGRATFSFDVERTRRDFDEMWREATDDAKQIYTRDHLDRKIQSLENTAASTSVPDLSPVMGAMIEALTSEDPEVRYMIDGNSKLIDRTCMLARIKPFLPDRVFDRVVAYFIPYSIKK